MIELSQRQIDAAVIALALTKAKHMSVGAVVEFLYATNDFVLDEKGLLERAGVVPGALNATVSACRKTIETGMTLGVRPVLISDSLYPPSLRMIADAPVTLFVRGPVESLAGLPGVAVVGTRKATSHGLTIAERIAEVIGRAGYSVVSGLALGIDAAAHEGALKTQAPTVAVLAHGLEKPSPRANAPLADRILDQGGLWVSEHPVGVPARPEYFVLRNRIQVGLSCASIIVEGEERSGSMTQAEFCLRNRRALFAVLPRPEDAVSTQHALPRMLVEHRGAQPIRSKDDYSLLLETVARRRDDLLSDRRT